MKEVRWFILGYITLLEVSWRPAQSSYMVHNPAVTDGPVAMFVVSQADTWSDSFSQPAGVCGASVVETLWNWGVSVVLSEEHE